MKRAYRFVVLLAFVVAGFHAASLAQASTNAVGQWVVRLGERTFLVLSLRASRTASSVFYLTPTKAAIFSAPTLYAILDQVSCGFCGKRLQLVG